MLQGNTDKLSVLKCLHEPQCDPVQTPEGRQISDTCQQVSGDWRGLVPWSIMGLKSKILEKKRTNGSTKGLFFSIAICNAKTHTHTHRTGKCATGGLRMSHQTFRHVRRVGATQVPTNQSQRRGNDRRSLSTVRQPRIYRRSCWFSLTPALGLDVGLDEAWRERTRRCNRDPGRAP